MDTRYGISVHTILSYEEARETIIAALKEQGFGVLTEIEIGLLLPCNVIVYEAEGSGSVVSAMNALAAMEFTGNPTLKPVAEDATARLNRALAKLPLA
jgi:uncharacterized protein (DUF302 family)